ncbi:hypothetical protein F5J12DRAFT_850517 [Pisolithus orientalis]|uniref:uncharacterized protein n=1 Tax=Pisolithus orientalis TaxID=936130 RepID=UPI0022243213|nr:uncharacterized protein F5J12DRAFT_850517 [Pisolithus orientalis]KAI5997815.1 hypothetical protein F5J12DRAFT_850517 [Pisolithus orientalis]
MGLIISTIAGCWSVDGDHVFTSGRSPRKRRTPKQGLRGSGRILFYEKGKPYYEFTNFSPHDVVYKGKRYPTSEHLFQAFKFIDAHPHIAERIRTCSEKPVVAFDEAHKYQGLVRADWSHVHIDKVFHVFHGTNPVTIFIDGNGTQAQVHAARRSQKVTLRYQKC